MTQIRLHKRPKRVVRCADTPPPPFRFHLRITEQNSGVIAKKPQYSAGFSILKKVLIKTISYSGRAIDLTFAILGLTLLVAIHMAIWGYSFGIGVDTACTTLGCPPDFRLWAPVACFFLTVVSYVISRVLRLTGNNLTSLVVLVMVTIDLAATIFSTIRLVM